MKKSGSAMAQLPGVTLGEPLSVPEVVEEDSEILWQRWLNAVADMEAVVEFEPTRPQPLADR